MKKSLSLILVILISLISCASCNTGGGPDIENSSETVKNLSESESIQVTEESLRSTEEQTTEEQTTEEQTIEEQTTEVQVTEEQLTEEQTTEEEDTESKYLLNGVDISKYTIIYSESQPDYNFNAAKYIRSGIAAITGIKLDIETDSHKPFPHEIIVGETRRELSRSLNADTDNFEFALLANETSVAMEGDYFVIAAAAYYFIDTYITGDEFDSTIPDRVTINTPIQEKPNNFIFLIGDGMGMNHTQMFDYLSVPTDVKNDGEDIFYGHMFPYLSQVRTKSLSGVTDSAAGGTALATGYKTINGYVGKDQNQNDLMSLTELANSLGKSTAVMSTEGITGATPAAFSAHALSRTDIDAIKESQALISEKTILLSLSNSYDNKKNTLSISNVLYELNSNENGFFLMYEEAYIDKHSHSNDLESAFKALIRFNRAIGQFMEFAFYHPDTLVIITADHETGDLRPDNHGELVYNYQSHTYSPVYLFSYGIGAEVFNQTSIIDNIQIPKTIAKMWGVNDFGDTKSSYGALN